MGKYENYSSHPSKSNENKVHPIWRGIGFLFIIFIPILSFASGVVLIEQNNLKHWMPVPYDLLAHRGNFLYFGDSMMYIKLILAFAIMCIFYALFALVTFSINSMAGASRYGPYDLPPVKKPRGIKMGPK